MLVLLRPVEAKLFHRAKAKQEKLDAKEAKVDLQDQ
jgi:hypothetical protein